eukprot:scpid18577/ scgid6200/ Retrotransposable element Tf2 155 kDa protein type 1
MAKATIEPFDGGDFEEYQERLNFFFIANEIGQLASSASNADKVKADKRMTAYLISLLSKTVYSTLKTLCLPKNPTDFKYSEIVDKLKVHYKVKTSRTTATHKFRQCVQGPSESVTDYSHKLQRCAVECKFGDHLDRALCDQFVAGLRDLDTRKFILSKPDDDVKSFQNVFQLALTEETAGLFARTLQASGSARDQVQDDGVHELRTRHSSDKHKFQSKSKSKTPTTKSKACYRCGAASHLATACQHKDTRCRHCHKTGHLERVCLSKKRQQDCHQLQETISSDDGESVPMYHVYTECVNATSTTKSNAPLYVPVEINGVTVEMEVDTGSGVTILTEKDFQQCNGDLNTLQKSTVILRGFSGAEIKCIGEFPVPVTINGKTESVTVRVVATEGPSLLGRDLLNVFTLPWKQMLAEKVHRTLGTDQFQKEFPALFDHSTLGKMNGVQIHLHVDDGKPRFCKPRSVPFHIREQYEASLDKLERDGVIQKVTHSDWAAPTVPVRKPDGSIRVCGDYSVTINKCSKMDHHPLPTLDEMLTKLCGGERFTKLDLSQAYHQLELSPESRVYTTINTHRGLYEFTRLPFGVNSAVSIFQRTMENLLAGLPGCVVYIDDILVTGKTDEEHAQNLRRVLQRLEDAGMKLKHSKIEFMSDVVVYLGHKISARGVQPTDERIDALKSAKPPKDVAELQSFIGSANYLRRFIPHFAEQMAPLYTLLKRDTKWNWGPTEQQAFEQIRNAMSTDAMLSHFSMTKNVVLQVDASGFGLGAVLLQEDEDGFLRPVAYASRVLTAPEKNYSQIEREALALVFGANKFRQYLLGKSFTLRTDHKPLLSLFDPHNAVPTLTSTRLKKWRLVLSAYDYRLEFVKGKENIFADYLSRKPTMNVPSVEESVTEEILHFETENILTADTVATETRKDPTLTQVMQYVKFGWPVNVDTKLQPYYSRRFELTVQNGVLIWDSRVVIPNSLQHLLLQDLHSEHTGIVRMKRMARQYVWWPGLDSHIENTVKLCRLCQENAKKPAKDHGSWSWPAGPWKRLHLDFAGPFLGTMFLVLVDSYSKYIDVVPMKSATTQGVITMLRSNFAIFGLPEHVVTDNGSQFTSAEFKSFLSSNGIVHTLTAPGHPATNGLAERYVGHFKSKVKLLTSETDLSSALYRFLLTHRTTPTVSGKSPATLLMNRQPRTRYDLLHPTTAAALDQQVRSFQQNCSNTPEYSVGDAVYALNFSNYGSKWVPGVVLSIVSPMNYRIQVDEVVWKRHRNQLRPRSIPGAMIPSLQPPAEVVDSSSVPTPPMSVPPAVTSTPPDETPAQSTAPSTQAPITPDLSAAPAPHSLPKQPERTQPRRNVGKPLRYRNG